MTLLLLFKQLSLLLFFCSGHPHLPHRLIVKVHKEALIAMRTFWEYLLSGKVTFEMLSGAIERIDVSVRTAERVYRSILTRHPNSIKLLRLYARFLLDIKNDPWTAAKWLT